ncbi:MAG: cytochrome c, partial [Pseudomonadota bacterium]
SPPPHQLFKQYCSRCHGVHGQGKAEVSSALKVEMANFQSEDWQNNSTKSYITNVILKGGAQMGLNAGMPPWGSVLSTSQAESLAEYIKYELNSKGARFKRKEESDSAGGGQ